MHLGSLHNVRDLNLGSRLDFSQMRLAILKRFNSTLKDFNVLSSSKKLEINSVLQTGFKVNNEKINGPLILVNQNIYHWDVPMYGVGGPFGQVEEGNHLCDDKSSPFYGWNTDMLYLFEYLENRPELLLLGAGQNMAMLPAFLKDYLKSLNIKVEVLKTQSAASTFNFLKSEDRNVAFAGLPLIPTDPKGKILVQLSNN